MAIFRCGHPYGADNLTPFRSRGKPSVRCRTCYNALRKEYQRRRYPLVRERHLAAQRERYREQRQCLAFST